MKKFLFIDLDNTLIDFNECARHSIINAFEELGFTYTESVFKNFIEENVEIWKLTDKDWEGIHEISRQRYGNWEWNYGKSPKFNVKHSHRFPVGGIDVRLQVEKGMVEDAKIFGDFFGVGDVSEIENAITGVKYERASLDDAVSGMDIPKLLGGITKEEFLKLIY